jgi:hypothetical protein
MAPTTGQRQRIVIRATPIAKGVRRWNVQLAFLTMPGCPRMHHPDGVSNLGDDINKKILGSLARANNRSDVGFKP